MEAENFPGALINEENLIGFYATRFVQAESPEEAEMIALSNLRHEESLRLPEGVKPTEQAKVYFKEIEEANESDVPEIQAGLTFYVMGT